MKTVVISQPTYLPWLGYFRVMKEADTYVFLDRVQYEKRSWQCRNQIKSPENRQWLTVPTCHKTWLSLEDVRLDNSKQWKRQHLSALRTCYGKAPFFGTYFPFFKSLYEKRWVKLASLNCFTIEFLAAQLGLSPVFLRSSQLRAEGKRTKLLLNICKRLKATRYVSSIGAKEYMRNDGAEELFRREGIDVEFLEYKHPEYPQLFGKFISNQSIVDCLFNCGPKSADIAFGEETATFSGFT